MEGGGTIREEKLFQIADPPLGELEADWLAMLAHVGPLLGAGTKPWIWTVARPIRVIWKPETVGSFQSVDHLQTFCNSLYYQIDESVELGEHLDWPVLWPRGTYLDIVHVSDIPQLKPRLSLKSKLNTPQPARALRHPADLARAFDKRVANVVTLKIDHGPERAQSLFEGFCRCIHLDKVPGFNLLLDSVSPNFRSIWWANRSNSRKMPVLVTLMLTCHMHKYYSLVRPDHKPTTDEQRADGIPAGQLITAMHPFWTSLFAPIFGIS